MNDSLHHVLFTGEDLLWSGKPHKFCYVIRSFGKLLPVALIFLLFDGFFISTMFSTGIGKEMLVFMIIFFAFHLMPVWICVGKIVSSSIERKNIIYAITNRRIILRSGVVGVDFESADYTDINNIRVDVSFLERLFKVGTLIIASSSGSILVFRSIGDPYTVYKKVSQVLIDIKSDIHYPNAYRPEFNPGYQTQYKKGS